MTSPEVVCLGELVWDCYGGRSYLGGAPFNVAVQLARHHCGTALLTAVGLDDLGRRALDFLREEGIPGAREHPRLPTGTVSVDLDASGQPRFTIHGDGAWTDLEGAETLDPEVLAEVPAVLVFGGLAMHAPGNRHLLEQQLERWCGDPGGPPIRLCDLNLRPGWADPAVARWCLEHCHYLKVNREEAGFLAAMEGCADLGAVLERRPLRGICITLGPDGLVWKQPGRPDLGVPAWKHAPPVVDTLGAGDAVTAALAAGLAAGEAPARFLERSQHWAAWTCAVPGALPPRA
jgi:fructokinase